MVNLKDIYIKFYPVGVINSIDDNIDVSPFIDNTFYWFNQKFRNDLRSVFNNYERYEFKRCNLDSFRFELNFYNVDLDVRNITEDFIKSSVLDIDEDGDDPMYFGYDRIELGVNHYNYIYLLGNPNSAEIRIVDPVNVRIEDL